MSNRANFRPEPFGTMILTHFINFDFEDGRKVIAGDCPTGCASVSMFKTADGWKMDENSKLRVPHATNCEDSEIEAMVEDIEKFAASMCELDDAVIAA